MIILAWIGLIINTIDIFCNVNNIILNKTEIKIKTNRIVFLIAVTLDILFFMFFYKFLF